ncbi:Mov34/MPN/PAD-1 family protein [Novosphingobium pentaromativorans]|uniref:PAD1/JAB1 superfamily metal-dependent protease n=1 Tax=Novosphingobium pentaromativorans US6-1 TaxID=1088721 RepID=G6E8M6_9SPHN|nr:M67 family metallopeptidase [Novosphingobium pentaromativorans]AIT81289.1 peptidase [Novosphingobium pentaromativorans US6-1]EHJ62100.1 PAD1/JAB1 superfamily metal-dependent protease [Novosphingobium pentaromativorans US6-1]
MVVEVTSAVLARLLEEAQKAAPRECCGVLMGQGTRIDEVRAAANLAPEPERRFEIDPLVLLASHKEARAGGRQVVGYYHSHPAGHPVPSATDCEHASGDRRVWAIVAGEQVALWRDGAEGFERIEMRVTDA